MMQISETEAYRACRILFGTDLELNRSFLQYLQPSGAHSAYRKKAKSTHPDSHHCTTHENHHQNRLFQDLNQAHQLVQNYLRQRELLASRKQSSTNHRSPKATRPAHRSSSTNPEQRRVPTRPLQFGLYLYYRGIIPFKMLFTALAWQRQQRPAMGQIAQRWGWLQEQEVGQILACRKIGPFGERAEHLGLLSALQVRAILLHQRTRQEKLGNYFIAQGLLTPRKISQLLSDLSEHNLKYRHGYSHHFYYHH
ncbi:MAG: J domain-containing protein [Geopsychrobacter sp.]|nr:J domain-containing protein [Geopsychrobacter sp.]